MSEPWWSRLGTVICLVAAIGLLGAIGLVVGGSETGTDDERRRQVGLRPRTLVDSIYALATPVVDALAARGVRPNHVTATALGLAGLTGLALAADAIAVGAVLLVVTGGCDLLDGHLARKLDRQSPAGAFFDSFADRIAEAFIFGGLAYAGAGAALTWLAVWALVASLAISYARARGEGLGVDGAVGLMQRPERFGLLIVTLGIAALVDIWPAPEAAQFADRVVAGGIGLLAVLATGTAIRRARTIFTELRTDDLSTADPETSSRSLDPGADSES
ncbi:MAG: CDP-alcohol phosphatidyltransferase family protein [Bradymonadaceae bacterium]